MAIWKLGGLAIAAVIGSGLLIGQASAMPANGMATVAGKVGDGTQEVRWVGGWRGGLGWRGVASAGVAPDGAAAVGAWAGAAAGLVDGAGIAASMLTADRFGWRRGFYGGGYGGYAGWRRPLYAYGGPGLGYNRWGWRRPLLAAATVAAGIGVASTEWDSSWYGNNQWDNYGGGFAGGPYYAYAGQGLNVGWNGGWNRLNPGWGWRRNYWSW